MIEQDRGVRTANRVTRTIYDAVQSLRALPYRGRHGRLENTRELVIPPLPYIVVYEVSESRLVILNVLHYSVSGVEHSRPSPMVVARDSRSTVRGFERWSSKVAALNRRV